MNICRQHYYIHFMTPHHVAITCSIWTTPYSNHFMTPHHVAITYSLWTIQYSNHYMSSQHVAITCSMRTTLLNLFMPSHHVVWGQHHILASQSFDSAPGPPPTFERWPGPMDKDSPPSIIAHWINKYATSGGWGDTNLTCLLGDVLFWRKN